ncbi:NAM domain-containing protein [Cephalotus follicularis]|uniref:NAM domain-containing protein n=1 Tax=Cephalotus follicularis TaxID=3775 RepID=A0A1Q3CT30_CEPFO|nr:NAM domain-containing protein [Cephalotus follicularis]
MSGLPMGFHFLPTEEDLIDYLRRKVKKLPLPLSVVPGIVIECDLYGDKEPWEIFDPHSTESFYAFTRLKRRSQSRIERRAGIGTWDGRQTSELEDCDGKVIGFAKYFVFKVVEKLTSYDYNYGRWVMHEYSLVISEQVGTLFNYFLQRFHKSPCF